MVPVEATARDEEHCSEGRVDKNEVDPLLPSAEQCLAAMKTRIKIIYGVSKTLTGNLSESLLISHAFTCCFNKKAIKAIKNVILFEIHRKPI